jgi:chlorobactene glucosyltransferase
MNILIILFITPIIVISSIAIVNTITFPRLKPHSQEGDSPFVSILIPARDESTNIQRSIKSILSSNYQNFELILLDDHSLDNTAKLALDASAGDPRFRLISSKALPQDWTGKNWACHQLSEVASGEIFVFTDADVFWKKDALSSSLWTKNHYKADLLTIFPTQITHTWAERLIVPMMMFIIIGYLPELLVRLCPWSVFSAANGQVLIFHRTAYEFIGGHAAVRDNVVEDLRLAWKTKHSGLRLVMALGENQIFSRMYHNWSEVRDGFAKNILAGHGGKPFFLWLSWIFHWSFFLLPFVSLVFFIFLKTDRDWIMLPIAMISIGILIRMLSAAVTRQRLIDAFTLPISVLLISAIASKSLYWYYKYGGPIWKRRSIQNRK